MTEDEQKQKDEEFDKAMEEFFAALKGLSPEQAEAVAQAIDDGTLPLEDN